MAVGAGSYDFFFEPAKLSAGLRAMARETAFRNHCGIALALMNVVTSGASHSGRELITPAELQKRHLIAVDIRVGNRAGGVWTKIFVQNFPGYIGEGIPEWRPQTSMALRTQIAVLRACRRLMSTVFCKEGPRTGSNHPDITFKSLRTRGFA